MLRLLISLLSCSCILAMQSPVDVIQNLNATSFLKAAQDLNEQKVLGGDPNGPYTILVPVDSAFNKLSANELAALSGDAKLLSEVVNAHIIPGELFSWDFVNGRIVESANGHYIRVYKSSSGSTYLNDARVLQWDIEANGAVIILIDTVLDAPEGTLYEILRNPDYGLKMFADLTDQVHLNRTLDSKGGPYTVFVPSQAAFDRLPASVLQTIANDRSLLNHVIQYHIHYGTLHLKSLDRNSTLTTLYRNHNIKISVTGNDIFLNNVATLEEVDIDADNGVMHIIDHVLIPSTLGAVIG